MGKTTLKNTLMGVALSIAAMVGLPSGAKADDYCREYTRTVNVGGMTQDAYGTACLQPDGSWMIVGEGLGNDIPNNAANVNYVIHDNRREVIPTRVVYYEQPRVNYYRPRPAPIFVWSSTGHYRGNKFYGYNHRRDYDRHDRWDRHDNRHDNRGRGRDRH